ncbi:conserved hypothetical protein [Frankia canadensis]|uniref:Uncharacterized protein n=1 Tax=Frankia canadensis TaxID=1836972 RepID=A0A2I2L1N4_9ACTN|nr:hypothetical protein [Frankia canadensis]SNQ51830.1 conserved hypothetical protein [Frankia canadensis]SOU59120.1 conserved hypothetical protein [Frankia canadensis]
MPGRDEAAWVEEFWREGARGLDVESSGTPTPSASGNVVGGPVGHRGGTARLRVGPFLEDAVGLVPCRRPGCRRASAES